VTQDRTREVVALVRTLGVFLRRTACGLTVLISLLGIAFASGYLVEDPGGGLAVALIAAMVLPLAWLTTVAVRNPRRAVTLISIGVALLAGYALISLAVHLVEGPVVPLAALVLAVPIAVLGLLQPREAGRLLLLVAAVPLLSILTNVLLRGANGPHGPGVALGGSTGVVVPPLLTLAVMFLLAARLDPQVLERPHAAARRRGTMGV
jgi:hypothetical protein